MYKNSAQNISVNLCAKHMTTATKEVKVYHMSVVTQLSQK